VLFRSGLIAFQNGQFDTAAQWISQALATRPDYVEAYNSLGNLSRAQGKADEAIAAYRKALTLQPSNENAQNNLAAILAEQDHALPPPTQAAPSRIDYQACPLCGSTEIPPAVTADCSQHPLYQAILPPGMTWRRCDGCKHVFTDGYFDNEVRTQLFSHPLPHQTVGHDAEEQRKISARMVARMARHCPPEGDWLDVNFGNASLLFAAEEWGYRPVGINLHAENVRAMRQLGYEAHGTPLEELAFDGRFSVLSMVDVLERMPFPHAGLEAAQRLLQPGGALLVSTPNMGSTVWRLLDADNVNPYWGELEHYHIFSRQRLYALLAEHGFKPVDFNISERYRVGMEVIAVKD